MIGQPTFWPAEHAARRTAIRSTLGEVAFMEAQAQGATMTLEQAVGLAVWDEGE
jgi:hypothetical protein